MKRYLLLILLAVFFASAEDFQNHASHTWGSAGCLETCHSHGKVFNGNYCNYCSGFSGWVCGCN